MRTYFQTHVLLHNFFFTKHNFDLYHIFNRPEIKEETESRMECFTDEEELPKEPEWIMKNYEQEM